VVGDRYAPGTYVDAFDFVFAEYQQTGKRPKLEQVNDKWRDDRGTVLVPA
jgi:hypothetical protein